MTTTRLDALLQLVADRHRRLTIRQLRDEANGVTTMDDLLDELHDRGSGPGDYPLDREQLAIQLYHVHLPTLADHGVVAFDPEHGAVRYRPDEQLETVLDSLPDERSIAHP